MLCLALMRRLSSSRLSWIAPLVVAGAGAGAGAGGCGDDLPPASPDGSGGCVSTEVAEFPEGPYDRPEELALDESSCEPGSLADVDLTGRWSIVGEGQFEVQIPFVRESCTGGIQMNVVSGLGELLIHRDDSNLFWRSQSGEGEWLEMVAGRACAIPGSDELALATVACYEDSVIGSQCYVEQSRMKRFTRPAGETEAEGLELVSEWSGLDPWPVGLSLNVKVAEGVAFVARQGELRLVDVSDPAQPSDLAVIDTNTGGIGGADFNDVKLFEVDGATYAVLAGGESPIVDASDPARPFITSRLGEYAHSIFLREDEQGRPLAYLATYGIDVPIYDLSDPTEPVLVDRVPLAKGEAVHDLFADEDRLYLNATVTGFQVRVRNGSEWPVQGTLPSPYSHASWVGEVGGRLVAIAGDEGVDAHLLVIDVDPASPEFMTEIGAYQTRREVSIHNMMLLGDRVYLTYYHDGVRILDLSDPTSPELLAYFHTWSPETGGTGPFEGAIGLDVDREAGLIYVADSTRGLMILRETK
jgi:hypothetical protein